ncbi:hypothetical protein [Clostridium sp. UBA4395]|uniref:hypothetical protein n=1 Tax=Clostridium sp. UBA4395 TaxID=1946360 RepID=UPI003217A3D7
MKIIKSSNIKINSEANMNDSGISPLEIGKPWEGGGGGYFCPLISCPGKWGFIRSCYCF